jgi:tRNA-dihydrouridine synthase C
MDRLLGALRETVQGRFTVKTRIGYEHADEFEMLLAMIRRHAIDAIATHGRSVLERYWRNSSPPQITRLTFPALPDTVRAMGERA